MSPLGAGILLGTFSSGSEVHSPLDLATEVYMKRSLGCWLTLAALMLGACDGTQGPSTTGDIGTQATGTQATQARWSQPRGPGFLRAIWLQRV
jgi:hypothetical protein